MAIRRNDRQEYRGFYYSEVGSVVGVVTSFLFIGLWSATVIGYYGERQVASHNARIAESLWKSFDVQCLQVDTANNFWQEVAVREHEPATSEELLAHDVRATYLGADDANERVAAMQRLLVEGRDAYEGTDTEVIDYVFEQEAKKGITSYLGSQDNQPWTAEGLLAAVKLSYPEEPASPRTQAPFPGFWEWARNPCVFVFYGGIGLLLFTPLAFSSRKVTFCWLPTRDDWGWWLLSTIICLPCFMAMCVGHGLFLVVRPLIAFPKRTIGVIGVWRASVRKRREERGHPHYQSIKRLRRLITEIEEFLKTFPVCDEAAVLGASLDTAKRELEVLSADRPAITQACPTPSAEELRRIELAVRGVDEIVATRLAEGEQT